MPKSVFIHIPKTGGSWVKGVLQKSGLVLKRKGWHSVQIVKGKYHFCFVRHPVTWYQSIWAYNWKENHWHYGLQRDLYPTKSKDFNEFIHKVVERFPNGFLYKFYEKWTKHCQFVGKYENIDNDLIQALANADEIFDKELIHDMKANYFRNVAAKADDWKDKCLYKNEDTVKLILQIEKRTVKKYGYDYTPEGIVSGTENN